MNDGPNDTQAEEWERLYERVTKLLARYGKEDAIGNGDYLVVDDNYGWRRSQVEIHNLKMLNPEVVIGLRDLLSDMLGWEITVTVDVPGKEGAWPVMGLTIRKHEIIDGLQRQYFPPEFQNLAYEGSRPGTGYD
jgi:hypothetical protein